MTAGPHIRSRELWSNREAKFLSIIERALHLLRQKPAFPVLEVELNRCFYFCLLSASHELYPDDELAPILECNNQPDPDDEVQAPREKAPRFSMGLSGPL
jgi:hypothetical protein